MKPELPAPLESRLEGFSFQPVTVGRSGAGVYRLSSPVECQMFLKIAAVTDDPVLSLRAEAEKLEWMAAHDLPVPGVLHYLESEGQAYLLTTALNGRDASQPWLEAERRRLVEALAGGLRRLHATPISACPFDARLELKLAQARERFERGLVDLEDLDEERQGHSGQSLLAELLERRPATEDLVFCHGDSCLPNVILNPDSLRLAGFVDLGRAGVADRYQDLALMTRSLESRDLNPQFSGLSGFFLERYGIDQPDLEKIEFYRLLDEFF